MDATSPAHSSPSPIVRLADVVAARLAGGGESPSWLSRAADVPPVVAPRAQAS